VFFVLVLLTFALVFVAAGLCVARVEPHNSLAAVGAEPVTEQERKRIVGLVKQQSLSCRLVAHSF
jgi:hypothetical protein